MTFKPVYIPSIVAFFLLIFALPASAQNDDGTEELGHLYVEKLEVSPSFQFYRLIDETYDGVQSGDMEKDDVRHVRASWASPGGMTSRLWNVIEYDDDFISFSDADSATVFISLMLDSMTIYQQSSKKVEIKSHFRYRGTDYRGNVIREKDVEFLYVIADAYVIYSGYDDDFSEAVIDRIKSELPSMAEPDNVVDALEIQKVPTPESGIVAGANAVAIVMENGYVISGLVISNDGYLLTDYRAFSEQPNGVLARFHDGTETKVQLVRMNKLHNVALAKLEGALPKGVQAVKVAAEPAVSDAVTFFGTPGWKSLVNSYAEGIVAAKTDVEGADCYFIDAMPHWGYTGCGVFDANHALLGTAIVVSFDKVDNLVMPCLTTQQLESSLSIKF